MTTPRFQLTGSPAIARLAIVLILATLALLGVPGVSAHTTPTAREDMLMDQVVAPTTGVTTCDQTSASIATTPGASYLLVLGAAANGSATSRVYADTGAETAVFIVDEAGAVTVSSGYTAHLLFHQNISVSGAGNAFWAWLEYVPKAGATQLNINAATTGGTDAQLLQPYAVTGSLGIVANFTTRGGGCPHPHTQGRAYNATFQIPSEPIVTARAGNKSVQLSWARATGEDYALVFNARSSHACTADNVALYYSLVANTSTQAFVHTGRTNGLPEYYCVRAINATLTDGTYAAEVNATPWFAPQLVGSTGSRAAVLAWNTGGYADITNFTLYRGAQSGNLTPWLDLLPEARGYNDPLNPGQAFYYAIRVTNATNTSAYSNEVFVRMPTMFNWSLNATRVVPDRVTAFINRTFQDTYWVDLVRFDRDGNPVSVIPAIQWNRSSPANFTFTYPLSRATNASLDVDRNLNATYHVFVTDGNGTYLDGRNFCITTVWNTTCAAQHSLSDASRGSIAIASAEESRAISAALQVAEEEESARSVIASGLSFFGSDPFGIGVPVLALIDFLALVLMVIAIIARRS